MTPPEEPDRLTGALVLVLLAQPGDWVNRRVESVRFVGERRLHRRVSVDFRLRAFPLDQAGRADHAYPPVPLTLLAKNVLTGFSVRDEDGSSVAMFTKEQNSRVAWSALVAAAELALGSAASPELQRELWDVANRPAREATTVLNRLLARRSPDALGAEAAALRSSSSFSSFAKVAEDLAVNFMLLVSLDPGDGERRVIKFSFDEPPRLQSGSWRSRVGWEPRDYRFDVPAVGDCKSYHFEVEPPSGLVVASASLVASSLGGSVEAEPAGGESLAHLYVSGLVPGTTATATVGLRAPVQGLLRVALLSATFALVVLVLGAVFSRRVEEVEGQADAAAALLLTVPGAVSAYVARPSEHVLASEILLGVRSIALATAVLLYAAAASVVLAIRGSALRAVWAALALAALATVCVLGRAAHVAGRRGYDPKAAAVDGGGRGGG